MISKLPQDLISYLQERRRLSPAQKKMIEELALETRERPMTGADMARRYVKQSMKAGRF